ncbi:hypothetical protein D3C85_771190 [compost metagenome]
MDKTIRLADCKGSRPITSRDALTGVQVRNLRTAARGAVEGPAVVAALQAGRHHPPQGQRYAPVRATVFQSKGLARGIPEQDQFLASEGHGQGRLIVHSFGKRHGPPAWSHHRTASLLLCFWANALNAVSANGSAPRVIDQTKIDIYLLFVHLYSAQ